MNREPSVTSDPRFRAGRTLVRTGGEGAIGMFATLVEESRSKYGDASIEAASCYYEYGNALLRVAQRKADDEENDQDEEDTKPAAEARKLSSAQHAAAADAAERRRHASADELLPSSSNNNSKDVKNNVSLKNEETNETFMDSKVLKNDKSSSGVVVVKTSDEKKPLSAKTDDTMNPSTTGESSVPNTANNVDDDDEENDDENDDEDDMTLALEMMENSWAIIDDHIKNQQQKKSSNDDDVDKLLSTSSSSSCYLAWAQEQRPRILIGLGDLFSFLNRHADAVDAYTRAIPFRESFLENDDKSNSGDDKKQKLTLESLKRQRLVVEVNVLVAEELLKCDEGDDVVTTSGEELVKASERVDFARGYYDRARDQLQETVYLMGRLAGLGNDIATEKEDVCFLATMLMNIGNILADLDEEAEAKAESADRKAKKLKKEEI